MTSGPTASPLPEPSRFVRFLRRVFRTRWCDVRRRRWRISFYVFHTPEVAWECMDDMRCLTFSVWLLGLRLTILRRESLRKYRPHYTGAYWYHGALYWGVLADRDTHVSSEPWWRHLHAVRPLDLLLGRREVEEHCYVTEDVIVPMPEQSYSAKVRHMKAVATRPRWPFKRAYFRSSISVAGGIPVPHSHEDFIAEDDAIYSITEHGVFTTHDMVNLLRARALEDRAKHGGLHLNLPNRS